MGVKKHGEESCRLSPELSDLLLELAKPGNRPLPLSVDQADGLFVPAGGGFSYLVVNPPFGGCGGARRRESAFLLQALDQLAPGGTCACIVPNGLLSRSSDRELRRKLVEEYWLSRVVMLPLHCFQPAASVRASILVVTKVPAPEQLPIQLSDLRSAGPGQRLDELLPSGRFPPLSLDREEIRAHQYSLVPEEYSALPPLLPEEDAVEEEREALLRQRNGQGDQLSLFPAQPLPLGEDRERDPRLLELSRRCLDARFLRWLHRTGGRPTPGRALFQLRNGEKDGEQPAGGTVPRYTAAGRTGFARRPTPGAPAPTLIVSRVGTYCGSVFRSEEPCWVSANAFYLTGCSGEVRTDILWLLLRAARLNRLKRGSGQPYLAQEQLLDRMYILPDLEAQDRFLKEEEPLIREVRTLEQRLGSILK